MDKILVLQSAAANPPEWIERCLGSVSDWARMSGYGYQFINDELFEFVPDWYLSKIGARTAIAADLARLTWAESLLHAEQAEVVVWMDADVLLFASEAFAVEISGGPVFGYEYWLQADGNKFKVRKNVHNAYCAFRHGCATLPFLIEATKRIIKNVDANFMAPQIVGPKLLTSLNNIVGFELEPRVGAVSPELHRAIAGEDSGELAKLMGALPTPMLGANLCSTLSEGRDMDELIDLLAAFKDGLK